MRSGHARATHRRAPPNAFVGEATAAAVLTMGVHANTVAGNYGTFLTSHNGATDIVPGSGTEYASIIGGAQQAEIAAKIVTGSADSIIFSGPASILRLRSWTWDRIRLGANTAWVGTVTSTATTCAVPEVTVYWPNSTVVIVGNCAKTAMTFSSSFTHDGTLVEAASSNTTHSTYWGYITNTSKFGGGTLSWDGTSLLHKAAVVVIR